MQKILRTLFVWILVSLILQFGGYSLLNKQMEQVIGKSGTNHETPITVELQATIPGSGLSNIQVSYAKDYVAYMENNVLKVFNLKKGKVVFEKKPPAAKDQTLGVLDYQWLPAQDILVYFYARKNPDAVTTVKAYSHLPEVSTISISPNSEDPKQQKTVPKTFLQPKLEKRYGNPQLTELYSLKLPNSEEDIAPDDHINQFESGSNEFPAGGKIEKIVVSPVTSLIYLTLKTGAGQQLMKIDIMNKLSVHSKPQEVIGDMVVSDRYPTLYIDSKIGAALEQVIAIQYDDANKKDKRYVISNQDNDRILGVRKGRVYIGEVKNSQLVRIKTTDDLPGLKDNPALETEWEGTIPFNKEMRSLIGPDGQIIIYDNQTAYIVLKGSFQDIKLDGNKNYLSSDGAELIGVTEAGNSSLLKLQPFAAQK